MVYSLGCSTLLFMRCPFTYCIMPNLIVIRSPGALSYLYTHTRSNCQGSFDDVQCCIFSRVLDGSLAKTLFLPGNLCVHACIKKTDDIGKDNKRCSSPAPNIIPCRQPLCLQNLLRRLDMLDCGIGKQADGGYDDATCTSGRASERQNPSARSRV